VAADVAKPQWSDAPEWANWLAMDESGVWFWYESQPQFFHGAWCNGLSFMRARVGDGAKESLEERPK
jgi:hypothetical protein